MLSGVLACPRCGGGIGAAPGQRCEACALDFPELDGIPCLFVEPQSTLGEWRNRLHFLCNGFRREIAEYELALKAKRLSTTSARRLKRVSDALADHVQRLLALLEPLEIGGFEATYDDQLSLRTRMPTDQGLATYYANVHRDWCWGDAENDQSCNIVRRALRDAAGRLLVLGSGAGRLAYDLHQSTSTELTIAADFNPMLALLARRMLRGETAALYEFPIAPRTIDDHAVLRTLSAPERARPGLELVLADAMRPPFRHGALDAVVAPWLVDILPEDFASFSRRINRLLREDGTFVIFGSLAFRSSDPASRYSLEECLEMLEAGGFGDVRVEEAAIPYMRSPASRHSRQELVVSISALKRTEATAPEEHQALPEWLLRDDLPVPLSSSFRSQATSTRVFAYIMSLIDGKRSPADIAAVMANEGLMTLDEARPAIRGFLLKMHEDSERQATFGDLPG